MSNKLKNIFSNKECTIGGNFTFKDKESYKKFLDSLNSLQDTGNPIKVEGILSIRTGITNGNNYYPLMINDTPDAVFITPKYENIPMIVDTESGEKKIIFQRYSTSSGTILQTVEDAIVFLKFLFSDNGKIQFSYKMQIEFAETVEQVVESYQAAIYVFDHLLKPDDEQNVASDSDAIDTIKNSFFISYSFWKKLKQLQDIFKLSFNPTKIGKVSDMIPDIEELYLLLIEKRALRIKLASAQSIDTKVDIKKSPLKIGAKLNISFCSERVYYICEQKIVIYTANLLINAVIKEIEKTDTVITKLLYGDSDSMPMGISFTGYLTHDEAKAESTLIMHDNIRKNIYFEALTPQEYYEQELSIHHPTK